MWVFCPGTVCSALRWLPASPGPQLSAGPPEWRPGPGWRSQTAVCLCAARGRRARRLFALDGKAGLRL